ncbi:Hypothetical predicted protein [Olea europaea subsp. europaea]|uniref:Uncharacterized protein n=1 Tax=Olea europaea subsp. europaea TaxID=158383 RepID=A0A8S0UZT9_OLEEU|nr:Hypothetical predicted protein [Olea europaea subsp. europaea]
MVAQTLKNRCRTGEDSEVARTTGRFRNGCSNTETMAAGLEKTVKSLHDCSNTENMAAGLEKIVKSLQKYGRWTGEDSEVATRLEE